MIEVFDPGDFYDARVNSYGLSPSSVGWKDFAQQKLRFDILTSEIDLNRKKIVDIGCGFGDLANYFISKGTILQEYIGVEVSKKMLEIAKEVQGDKKVQRFLGEEVKRLINELKL